MGELAGLSRGVALRAAFSGTTTHGAGTVVWIYDIAGRLVRALCSWDIPILDTVFTIEWIAKTQGFNAALASEAVMPTNHFSSIEVCAGAGGQALGLETAGFAHDALFEIEHQACLTLKQNRPEWNVVRADIRDLDGTKFRGVDLFAGGVPCPPFSVAGKQLGDKDSRDLFPTAIRLIGESRPTAVLLENVPGFATAKFADYRSRLRQQLEDLGYRVEWQVLNACNFGVPQLRPRFILVALRPTAHRHFIWPKPIATPPTVGQALIDLMSRDGWEGAFAWAQKANGIAPTLVGGSKLHGGPDLGPTRAKRAWLELATNAKSLADAPPGSDFPADGIPRLTVEMAARIQGFPPSWKFSGRKTAAYRQVGNAFPPPVARAVAIAIHSALERKGIARLTAASKSGRSLSRG